MPTNKFGYFHGRFQPFHLGHLEVVKFALSKVERLIIGISNPFRTPPVTDQKLSSNAVTSLLTARARENNPWPYWARILMISDGLRDEGIDLNRILIVPNLASTNLPIKETRFPKELTTVFITPKDYHNKAATKQYLDEGWTVHEFPLRDHLLGSGTIRHAISTGGQWETKVPRGTAEVIKFLANKFGDLSLDDHNQ